MTIKDKLRDRIRGTRTLTFAQSNWNKGRIWGGSLGKEDVSNGGFCRQQYT